MKILTFLILICLGILTGPGVFPEDMAAADDIIIVADQWCPYNCEPEDLNPGFMVEITRLVLGEAGHRVIYQNRPWTRAMAEVHAGEYQAVIGAVPGETKGFSPGFVFPKIEQARVHDKFFVVKDSTWNYSGTQSLTDQKLGIVQGYGYPLIQSYINAHEGTDGVQAMAGDNAVARNIQKLIAGRLTVVLEDEAVFKYTVRQMGLEKKFRVAGDGSSGVNNLYIAFTPAEKNYKSLGYAAALSAGMIKIRNNGKLAAILKKYGVADWR